MSDSTTELLNSYSEELFKVNKAYSFVRCDTKLQLLDSHILDLAMAAGTIADEGAYVDLGSGPGLPAVPIAIVRPNSRVYAIERVEKCISFLEYIKDRLKLSNLSINTIPSPPYSIITRAFSPANAFWSVISKEYAAARRVYVISGDKTALSPEGEDLASKWKQEEQIYYNPAIPKNNIRVFAKL